MTVVSMTPVPISRLIYGTGTRRSHSSSQHLPTPVNSPLMSGPATHIYLPLPPQRPRGAAPEYRKPTLISTYSHQPDRSIKHDDSSMAYYRQAPVAVDLNYGFDDRIEREEDENEHLDGICESLQKVWEEGGQGERKGGVITWRGMITRSVNLMPD